MPSSPARSAPARWCARPPRFGVRQLVKLIPVYGQTAGAAAAAAASFAATYAMGKAAELFPGCGASRAGSAEEVASVYRQALRRGLQPGEGARHRRRREREPSREQAASRRSAIPRLVLLAVALLLPAASLIPLGSLWLWQHGYILYWAIGTCVVVAAVYYLREAADRAVAGRARPLDADTADPGDPSWTPRQAEAWDDVMRARRAR